MDGRFPGHRHRGRLVAAACVLALVAMPVRAQTGTESSVGYIDSAIPRTWARLRFDAAYDDNRPERAEFFYPAAGPPLAETRVDYQELSAYFEAAVSDRLSGFVQVPVRFLNPEQNLNVKSLGDMDAGFKFALLHDPNRYLTFQLRTYIPTGNGFQGEGTDHVSLEPALLVYERLTERVVFEGELREWIPIGGSDFAGDIVRYGLGLSYDLCRQPMLRVAPVAELVGWTVLSGKDADQSNNTLNAAGNTIVNLKLGVRIDCGGGSTFYVGYGRALTGQVWYKDIVRVEYGLKF
jgi:hypothetical protein